MTRAADKNIIPQQESIEALNPSVTDSVAAVENDAHPEEFRVGGSRIILEKSHLADGKTEDPELPGVGFEVRLRILKEAGHEPLTNLLRGLGQLNVPGLGVALDTDDSDNKGIISATADAHPSMP